MQYQIHIHDRNYSSWEIQSKEEEKPFIKNSFDKTPFDKKLFHEDTFEIKENQEINIITSPTREAKYIAGILILEKNKTFGRTPNKKRLYYSCIPHDKHLPNFLVPYDIDIGFEKVFPNKYVLFRFDHWTEQEKHPYGLLVETIGDVTNLPSYDKYQLYAKNLHHPHKTLQKRIQQHIQTNSLDTCIQEILSNTTCFNKIEDRRIEDRHPIFSIDPAGCMDRDDALSIRTIIPNQKYIVSVYIANVAIWIEYFQIYTFLQETNISTIYLQDTVIPMLPTALSEKICSLDQTHDCFAIVMDFEIDLLAKTIQPIETKQCLIHVQHNFDYTSKGLELYSPYRDLLNLTQKFHPEICDSHDLVAFWMMQMNQEMARELHRNKTGIFRISTGNPIADKKKDPKQDIFLYIWENAISGKYVTYSEEITDYQHQVIGVPIYTHFTSPIRRMVDIYNQFAWISTMVENKEKKEIVFTSMVSMIDKINQDTKTIRKIQMESKMLSLLHLFSFKTPTTNFVRRAEMSDKTCTACASSMRKGVKEPLQTKGTILQIQENRITVYLSEYKTIYSCKTPKENDLDISLEKGKEYDFKIYKYERETDYRTKIKMWISFTP